MKMIEIQSAVDRHGQLTIPASLLRDMGLAAGDTVKLAYISNAPDSICNTLRNLSSPLMALPPPRR
jgi:bifunctional DNA-binding transcriptional regulator/antitoxin component of YhaV-PrlF toxin-antitoxin module